MLLDSCDLKVNIWPSKDLNVFTREMYTHVLLEGQRMENVMKRGYFQKYVCFGLVSLFAHVCDNHNCQVLVRMTLYGSYKA